MKVSVLGAGNVAFQLLKVFSAKGVQVVQLYNRTRSKAEILAGEYAIPFTDKLEELSTDVDIYIICVSDDGIIPFASKLKAFIGNKLVAHTSGAVDTNVLEPYFKNYGGLYPLQTFTINTIPDFEKIPVMVAGSTPENIELLKRLAKQISSKVAIVNDRERLMYHLAAVIANNFSNYLFGQASNLLKEHRLDFSMLLPLIEETVRKIHTADPVSIQTGPARRGDLKTISAHLALLGDHPELKKIYIDISNSINPELNIKQ